MKKNIELNKEEGTVTVSVSVDKRNWAREPVLNFRTKDIALLLEKEGIHVEGCLKNDRISNDGRNPRTKGEWVFKIRQEKPKVEKPKVEKPKVEKPTPDTETKQSLTNEGEGDKIKSKTKSTKKRK